MSTTFLNGYLEELYIEQPQIFEVKVKKIVYIFIYGQTLIGPTNHWL